jgi:hypothetical protein
MRAPDYVEPMIGWRAWLVVDDEGEVRLSSLGRRLVWVPRCELVANCELGFDHLAPAEHCSCGVYAARETELAATYMARLGAEGGCRHGVIGRVSLWGSVVECENGWRASHAYPERIYVPAGSEPGTVLAEASDLAAALSVYGVPVQVIDSDVSGRRLSLAERSATESAEYVTLLPLVSWSRASASLDFWGSGHSPEAA